MKDKLLAAGLVLGVIGFVILLGTAGASDCNSLPFDKIVKHAVFGLTMLLVGFVMMRIGGDSD